MKLVSLVGIFSTAGASHTYDLTIDMCDSSGCHPSQKRVALDANAKPGHENQVHVSGDSLTLDYAQWIGGPRVYLIEQDGVNENTLFQLESKEFSFDVELSSMTCGFNAAMYLVGMNKNQGGAEAGTKYCDAQAVGGTYCSEMDIFEGNTAAQQMTTHGCVDQCASYSDDWDCKQGSRYEKTVCDHGGCGMNPFRYGPGTGYSTNEFNEGWYGFGSQHQVDSAQPFTVTTRFYADHIERFYTQNGLRIELPTLYVNPPNDGGSHYEPFNSPQITEDYCNYTYDKWTGDGSMRPVSQMIKNSQNGMVLAMSAWYDAETGPDMGMSWMDGFNGWGQVGPCHSYPTNDQGTHKVTYSKIRFGSIGTTVAPAPPAPTPPPPPPPPPAPMCCQGGCGGYCQQGFCGESAGNCAQCSGQFCVPDAAPPAPTPPPPPPPAPSQVCCSGGGCGGYCQQGWCGQSASNCAQCSGQFQWCPGVLV